MSHENHGALKYVCILPDYVYQSNRAKGNMSKTPQIC